MNILTLWLTIVGTKVPVTCQSVDSPVITPIPTPPWHELQKVTLECVVITTGLEPSFTWFRSEGLPPRAFKQSTFNTGAYYVYGARLEFEASVGDHNRPIECNANVRGRRTTAIFRPDIIFDDDDDDTDTNGSNGTSVCQNKECNIGNCEVHGNRPQCVCDPRWWGPVCDRRDACSFNKYICQNGGTCTRQVAAPGFSCRCAQGYSGIFCQNIVDIDHCAPVPCKHGATCIDLVNGYTCACAPGYTDHNCSTGTTTTGKTDTTTTVDTIVKCNKPDEMFMGYCITYDLYKWMPYIITSLVIVPLLVIAIGILIYCNKRKKDKNDKDDTSSQTSIKDARPRSCPKTTHNYWVAFTELCQQIVTACRPRSATLRTENKSQLSKKEGHHNQEQHQQKKNNKTNNSNKNKKITEINQTNCCLKQSLLKTKQ